eukprot:COSAG01_NODE_3243_length_6366_cov_53.945588_7_plen_183_part_00
MQGSNSWLGSYTLRPFTPSRDRLFRGNETALQNSRIQSMPFCIQLSCVCQQQQGQGSTYVRSSCGYDRRTMHSRKLQNTYKLGLKLKTQRHELFRIVPRPVPLISRRRLARWRGRRVCIWPHVISQPRVMIIPFIRTTISPDTDGSNSCHERTMHGNSLRLSGYASLAPIRHWTIFLLLVHQ